MAYPHQDADHPLGTLAVGHVGEAASQAIGAAAIAELLSRSDAAATLRKRKRLLKGILRKEQTDEQTEWVRKKARRCDQTSVLKDSKGVESTELSEYTPFADEAWRTAYSANTRSPASEKGKPGTRTSRGGSRGSRDRPHAKATCLILAREPMVRVARQGPFLLLLLNDNLIRLGNGDLSTKNWRPCFVPPKKCCPVQGQYAGPQQRVMLAGLLHPPAAIPFRSCLASFSDDPGKRFMDKENRKLGQTLQPQGPRKSGKAGGLPALSPLTLAGPTE